MHGRVHNLRHPSKSLPRFWVWTGGLAPWTLSDRTPKNVEVGRFGLGLRQFYTLPDTKPDSFVILSIPIHDTFSKRPVKRCKRRWRRWFSTGTTFSCFTTFFVACTEKRRSRKLCSIPSTVFEVSSENRWRRCSERWDDDTAFTGFFAFFPSTGKNVGLSMWWTQTDATYFSHVQ